MEAINNFLNAANGIMWGPPMLILLVGTHIYLTFRLGIIQKYVFKGIKLSVTKDPDADGDVSQFAALATALAATIGTGNIVGVGTAIAVGGPGAVLWTWMTGIFGMATKYAEGLLAVKYRVKTSDGTMLGGPMYALERGLKSKWLGILFATFAVLASFGIGNMTQANSISGMLNTQFKLPQVVTGIAVAALTCFVIIGGVKSIAAVCEKLVPLMAFFYVLGCFIILVINRQYLPEAISTIVSAAFSPKAAAGGFVGSTIMTAARYGIARGLFSNESGLGSAPIAAAAAATRNPVRQALVSMTGTFWDTVVVCLMTGLVLVSSIIKSPGGFDGLSGGDLTNRAFDAIPVVGPFILAIGLACFAYSTILGWAYYGERCLEYLFGKVAIMPYRIIYSVVTFFGATMTLDVVWNFSDLMNACMAVPNLIALLALSGVLVSETKKYLWDDNIDGKSEDEIPTIQ